MPLRLSVINVVVNGLLFFLGLFFLGWQFAATPLFSTPFYPLLLGFFETLPLTELFLFLQDRLLGALFTDMLMSVCLIVRVEASSGGMDISPASCKNTAAFS